uniref:BPTI/Kunitz inhibitor domain-containing protein n=1 Tax=Rhabditophanes sp. KR3021 TaxID=114890 RepID=A0AC35U4G1_9BILA
MISQNILLLCLCVGALFAESSQEDKNNLIKKRQTRAAVNGGLTEKDKLACKELSAEYRKTCGARLSDKPSKDFCDAYENVCFQIPDGEPDQNTTRPSTSTSSTSTNRRKTDWVAFCSQYKQRFLYVCPDPFKYGQKAIVFCPLYSERCHLAVPEKPIEPNDVSFGKSGGNATGQLCAQYRGFAAKYCNNPVALTQQRVRSGCDKYARFCTGQRG